MKFKRPFDRHHDGRTFSPGGSVEELGPFIIVELTPATQVIALHIGGDSLDG
jgi:hypothetical protein